MADEDAKATVQRFWETLYTKDWEKLKTLLAADAFYEDVPTPDPGAHGPENIVKRLRIGLDPVVRFEHRFHRMVGEGSTVVLEHTEVWHFETGESMTNPFCTVHEVENGRIKLWRDYWDLNTMMAQLPKWFLERLAQHGEDEFTGG